MWSLQGFFRECVCGHDKGAVEYVYVVITGVLMSMCMWSLQGFCRVCVCGNYRGSVEYVYVVMTKVL